MTATMAGRAARWLVLALAATALGGCASGVASLPGGFTRYDAGRFSVAYPRDWRVAHRSEAAVQVLGPVGEGDVRHQLIIEVDHQFAGDFDNAVDGVDELGGLLYQKDRKTVRDEEVAVAGAPRARLLESTWTAESPAHEEVRMRQYDLFALTRDHILIYLTVNSAAPDFDEARFRAIVGSFAVR
jgi:hypothetical protein